LLILIHIFPYNHEYNSFSKIFLSPAELSKLRKVLETLNRKFEKHVALGGISKRIFHGARLTEDRSWKRIPFLTLLSTWKRKLFICPLSLKTTTRIII
jgi:hypothetical protein